MARKQTFAECSDAIERNLKRIVTRKGLKRGLANDLVEVYEDVVRLHRDLKIIVRIDSSRDDVKKALHSINAWSWHTADHLNSAHAILSDEL